MATATYDWRSMDTYDFVIIGAGAAGEAAAHLARSRDASVAITDRELFGGSCAYWACMPSKALLHAAAVHHGGGDYPWPKASAFRDYMINRQDTDEPPDDGGHVQSLTDAGATVLRGRARLDGPGRVVVEHDDTTHELGARNVIVAVGSTSKVPDLPGLDEIEVWTNRQGTSLRELPRSIAVLGGGPTGVEMAQVYARYGVPVTLIHPRDRVHDREHPRSSELLGRALEADGVTLRMRARAERIDPRGGADGAHRIALSDGSHVDAHEVMLAIGRAIPVEGLGLDTVGIETDDGRLRPDERLRLADGVYVIGDPAGPELHTHLAHYQGEMAVMIAMGDDVRPDFRAIPRATYTDPETASVGLQLHEAREQGIDAREFTVDIGTSAKGYVVEAQGHVTIVVDRASRTLLGAFIAGPGASEAIHEAVLALKARTPLAVLADTIHAFPTVARVLGTAFMNAHRELE